MAGTKKASASNAATVSQFQCRASTLRTPVTARESHVSHNPYTEASEPRILRSRRIPPEKPNKRRFLDALSPSTPPGSACRWRPAKARNSLGFKRVKPGALRSADRLKDGAFLACVTGKTGHRASLQRERSLDRLDDVAERGLLRVAGERSATAHPSVGLKDSCRGQAPKHLRKGCLRHSLRVGNPGNWEHRAARVAEQKAQAAKRVVGFLF